MSSLPGLTERLKTLVAGAYFLFKGDPQARRFRGILQLTPWRLAKIVRKATAWLKGLAAELVQVTFALAQRILLPAKSGLGYPAVTCLAMLAAFFAAARPCLCLLLNP